MLSCPQGADEASPPNSEQSSPTPAGKFVFSFPPPAPSGAAFGDSFSANTSALGSGQAPWDVHGDKPTSKDTLPGRRRVSLNKAEIPAVYAESSASSATVSASAHEGAATPAAEPSAISAGTGAAVKQAGFATSKPFQAPFSRPGSSVQPSGFAFHGTASAKEEDVGATAGTSIPVQRPFSRPGASVQSSEFTFRGNASENEKNVGAAAGASIPFQAPFSKPGAAAKPVGFTFRGNASAKGEDVGAMAPEVQTLTWRLDAAQATISSQQRTIDALRAQVGLSDAESIKVLLESCRRPM